MFFLAHCTFEDRGGEGPTHGYLTYLVKAGDVEAALEQLRARLIEAREEEGLFDGPARVYLEDLIEVRRLPPGGLIARYQAYLGPERTSIFKTFPSGSRAAAGTTCPATTWTTRTTVRGWWPSRS